MVEIPRYDEQWREIYPILKDKKTNLINKTDLRQIFLEKTHKISTVSFLDFIKRGLIYKLISQIDGEKNSYKVL